MHETTQSETETRNDQKLNRTIPESAIEEKWVYDMYLLIYGLFIDAISSSEDSVEW
jgi:hypothetical protein